jgi:hypothetical protein
MTAITLAHKVRIGGWYLCPVESPARVLECTLAMTEDWPDLDSASASSPWLPEL